MKTEKDIKPQENTKLDLMVPMRIQYHDARNVSGPRPTVGTVLVALLVLSVICSSIPVVSQTETGPGGRSVIGPVINELLYDPVGTDAPGEFVELFNPDPSSVNIEGWSLTDQDGVGPDIVFHGITLPSKGFLVVHTGIGTNETDMTNGVGHLFLGRTDGLWSNTGDDCLLLDSSGRAADYLTYGQGSSVDPPPANYTWTGTVPLVPEGYSIGRLPDGNGSAVPSAYLPLLPTPGKNNAKDPPPAITQWDVVPSTPEETQDILVWAKAADDIRIDRAQLQLNASDGTSWYQDMAFVQKNGRFESSVNGRQGGDWLNITVLAKDPIGQTTTSSSRRIYFKANVSYQLSADIHGPEGTVMPDGPFTITGHVAWTNGSKVVGQVTAQIPSTKGSWNGNFTDYINLKMMAPFSEGTFDVDVTVRSGPAVLTKNLTIVVGWPHTTLLCSVMTNITEDQQLMTGQSVRLLGSAWFSDGLPVKSAQAELIVHGTDNDTFLRTDDDGKVSQVIRAPSMAGDYPLELRIWSNGKQANASVVLRTTDQLLLTVQGKMGIIYKSGENMVLTGSVKHHDRTPASNVQLIVEVLGTGHKVMAFTGPHGNFTLNLVAPYYGGEYTLRVTAICGGATSSWTSILYVNTSTNNGNRTPGWEPGLVILGVVLAVGLSRRRAR